MKLSAWRLASYVLLLLGCVFRVENGVASWLWEAHPFIGVAALGAGSLLWLCAPRVRQPR
jgi:hypothetical protein